MYLFNFFIKIPNFKHLIGKVIHFIFNLGIPVLKKYTSHLLS